MEMTLPSVFAKSMPGRSRIASLVQELADRPGSGYEPEISKARGPAGRRLAADEVAPDEVVVLGGSQGRGFETNTAMDLPIVLQRRSPRAESDEDFDWYDKSRQDWESSRRTRCKPSSTDLRRWLEPAPLSIGIRSRKAFVRQVPCDGVFYRRQSRRLGELQFFHANRDPELEIEDAQPEADRAADVRHRSRG